MNNWIYIIENDYTTYPPEGYEVLVSDNHYYDVAYFIRSGEYKWAKNQLFNDDIFDFKSFKIVKWAFIA